MREERGESSLESCSDLAGAEDPFEEPRHGGSQEGGDSLRRQHAMSERRKNKRRFKSRRGRCQRPTAADDPSGDPLSASFGGGMGRYDALAGLCSAGFHAECAPVPSLRGVTERFSS